jgi:hypothetical protein
MRHIVLSDDGDQLAKNAYHRLLAALHFPESPRDQQQALLIASLEKEEFDRAGPEHYQPSEIMAATVKMIENRTAQMYVAGFVGFVFVWLAFSGQKPSLNRASIITACAANEFQHVQWRPSFDPTGEIRTKAATNDPASLERIFRQYRGVAHIAAARVAASELLEPLHLFDEAPIVTNAFIKSCAIFQENFEKVADVANWNLYDVLKHYPSSLRGWPPLDLGPDLMTWVKVGYDRAVEQGMIKN